MNKVFLIGRLTRNPELRYTSSNLATLRCSLAVDRTYAREGEDKETDFINIVAFGQRAEVMNRYLTKGSQIAVDGRIQTGSYDGQDGKKVYTTDVIIENFQFLDSKGSRTTQEGNSGYENQSTPYNDSEENTSSEPADSSPFADFGANIALADDEVPF